MHKALAMLPPDDANLHTHFCFERQQGRVKKSNEDLAALLRLMPRVALPHLRLMMRRRLRLEPARTRPTSPAMFCTAEFPFLLLSSFCRWSPPGVVGGQLTASVSGSVPQRLGCGGLPNAGRREKQSRSPGSFHGCALRAACHEIAAGKHGAQPADCERGDEVGAHEVR